MGAISALGDAADALQRKPVLLAGALVVAGVEVVVVGGASAVAFGAAGGLVPDAVPYPGLWLVAGYLLVEPLLAGGFLGLADEAVAGETTLAAFRSHAVANYGSLLAARLVVAVVAAVVAGFAVAAAVALGVSMAPEPGSGPTMHDPLAGAIPLLASALVVVLVVGPVVVVGHVLLQFYPAGVVLGDAGPLASFGYSVRLVRAHPFAALGYTLVALVGGWLLATATGVLAGPVTGGSGVGGWLLPLGGLSPLVGGGLSPFGGVAGVLVSVVVASVAGAVRVALLRTYYVAFVRSVTSE